MKAIRRAHMRFGLGLLFALFALGSAERGAKYLVIAADGYDGIVKPLADWRTKEGVPAKVVTYSQAGGSVTALHDYIVNAYNTWPVAPEFVCLVGSPDLIPSYNGTNDCYFGNMTGDYAMEIPVGRIWAGTARQCSAQVNKVLAYEKPQLTGDTLWFIRGTTCVNEDNGSDDTIYWNNSRVAHGYWVARGYAAIDSFSRNRGNNGGQVNAACSQGRAFVTYRGQGVGSWWGFTGITPSTWNNRGRLPVTVAGTCATVTLRAGESMYGDQFAGAGTPESLGGAIAYFGTTGVTSHAAFYRGAVFVGFFDALFGEANPWLGSATVRGRYRLDSLYRNQTRYEEWNLLGDPALRVWTARPRHPVVEYDSAIPMAPQEYAVRVMVGSAPVPGALVCVRMDSTVYATAETDSSGEVRLAVNPVSVGALDLTITGADLLPFEATIRSLVTSEPFLVGNGESINDYAGNHDGLANPGESLGISVGLHNLGQVTATGVTGVLRLSQAGVVILDSLADYGTIYPDSTVLGGQFGLALDSTLADGQTFRVTVHATDDQSRSWDCRVDLVVRAGRIEIDSVAVLDAAPGGNSNGRLGRGESARLELAVTNQGGGGLASVHTLIRCPDTTIITTDSTVWYGGIGAGQTRSGAGDWFSVQAPPSLPHGQPVAFSVLVWADGGTYRYADTLSFTVPAEQGTLTEPTGPDAYGYWCYDDGDTATGRAPVYSWTDISSIGTVIPAVSDSNDATRQLRLPFTFRHYGTSFDTISVCSNGWLAMGRTTSRIGANRPLPDTGAPTAMVAPFWDDLNPDEGSSGYGTAYQYYDTDNHSFVVEYSDFAHNGQPSIRETFEVIFYDQFFNPTPTGDGEIVFQYQRVSLNSGCTVGIESQSETVGLQYLYNNVYPPTAVFLQAGRALRFTTSPPLSQTRPWLVLAGVTVSDSTWGNGNGVAEPGESLAVSVSITNSGGGDATGMLAVLRSLDNEGLVLDSTAVLGDIAVGGQAGNGADPFIYEVAAAPSDSTAEVAVVLTGDNYSTVAYFSFGLASLSGVAGPAESFGPGVSLEQISPNPAIGAAAVSYALARAARVELALYDAAGRRTRTLVTGRQSAGRHVVDLAVSDLNQGVYFCRLLVTDAGGTHRLTRKLQVVK